MNRLKRVLCALLPLFLLLPLFAACGTETQEQALEYWTNEENSAAYTLENDILKFEMDGATSYFTLTDKRTGVQWSSVPENAADDPLADPNTKYKMQSTLLLTYCDTTGNSVVYDNYRYAIKDGTFRITQSEDSVRVDYMIGPNERVYIVPEVVSVARMDELMAQMSDEDKGYVLRTYRKLDPEKLKEDTLREMLELIPQLADGAVYALSSATGGDEPKAYQMEQLEAAFASIGYTEEDMQADSAGNAKESTAIQFNVSVIYSLDGDGLKTEVPEEAISYSADYPATELCLLPYFCAAADTCEGYLLVPDGGGAQIDLHNGKTGQNAYYANVYGWDEAYLRETRVQDTDAAFPVFGIARDGSYLMAVTADGAGELSVEADVGGKRCSYDTVHAIFTVVHGEDTSVSAKSSNTVRIFQSSHPTETLTVRYICGNSDSYVDMANRYREYLQSTYPAFGSEVKDGYPLVVGLIGAIDKTEKVLGIPVRKTYTAVSYQEAEAIVSDLADASNLRVSYDAVFNGGMDQTAMLKAKTVTGLGSAKEQTAFLQSISAANAVLSVGGYTELVMNNKGLSTRARTIRDTTDTTVVTYPYENNTQMMKESESSNKVWMLNLTAQERAMGVLEAAAAKWNGAGVHYEDVGNILYSDFHRKNGTSRDDMRRLQTQLLTAQRESGVDVTVSGGYEYAAACADCILDMDLSGGAYDIIDRSIPFYQIVLHGYVTYTGIALNQSENYRTQLLRTVEYGAGLYFCFTEADYQDLLYNRYTVYQTLYSANYSDWQQELAALRTRLDEELGHTAAQTITGHSCLTDTLTCTEYEDGTKVYVNYGTADCETNGITVPAEDWTVVKGD